MVQYIGGRKPPPKHFHKQSIRFRLPSPRALLEQIEREQLGNEPLPKLSIPQLLPPTDELELIVSSQTSPMRSSDSAPYFASAPVSSLPLVAKEFIITSNTVQLDLLSGSKNYSCSTGNPVSPCKLSIQVLPSTAAMSVGPSAEDPVRVSNNKSPESTPLPNHISNLDANEIGEKLESSSGLGEGSVSKSVNYMACNDMNFSVRKHRTVNAETEEQGDQNVEETRRSYRTRTIAIKSILSVKERQNSSGVSTIRSWKELSKAEPYAIKCFPSTQLTRNSQMRSEKSGASIHPILESNFNSVRSQIASTEKFTDGKLSAAGAKSTILTEHSINSIEIEPAIERKQNGPKEERTSTISIVKASSTDEAIQPSSQVHVPRQLQSGASKWVFTFPNASRDAETRAIAKATRAHRRTVRRKATRERREKEMASAPNRSGGSGDGGSESTDESSGRKNSSMTRVSGSMMAALARAEQRRLQNRASVQKCRGKQRARQLKLEEEREVLEEENKCLKDLRLHIENSGVLEIAYGIRASLRSASIQKQML